MTKVTNKRPSVTAVTTFSVMTLPKVMRKSRRDQAGRVDGTLHNSRGGYVSISGDSGDTGYGWAFYTGAGGER